VFGAVIEGYDVVEKIGNAPRDRSDRPETKIAMTRVTIAQKLAK
jgi:cyclophilin family peptidyl-prolyl cis-trans isomerase